MELSTPGFAVVELSTAEPIVSAFGVTARTESVMPVSRRLMPAVSVTAVVLLSRAEPTSSSEVLLRAQARPARTVASRAERITMVERCMEYPFKGSGEMLPPPVGADSMGT